MSALLSQPMTPAPEGCLSALDLDRFTVAGRPVAHAVSRHLDGCDGCRARLVL